VAKRLAILAAVLGTIVAAASCYDSTEGTVQGRIVNDTPSTVYLALCEDQGCSHGANHGEILKPGELFWQNLQANSSVPFVVRAGGRNGPRRCVELVIGNAVPKRPPLSSMKTVTCDKT
jgi:hypothetical protein